MCVALDPRSGAGISGGPAIRRCWWHDTTEKPNPSRRPRHRSGWLPGSSFSETPVRLSSGDLFLLYTDGLYGAGDTDHPRLAPAMAGETITRRARQCTVLPDNICCATPSFPRLPPSHRMTLRRWWSAVSMEKINLPRGKKCIALFVASVLISDHAENQS